MRFLIIAAIGLLVGCTLINTAFRSKTGQLFCAIETQGDGEFIVKLIEAEAFADNTTGGQIAIIATGATKQYVDAKCAEAAANVGATDGVPVSPPTDISIVPAVAVPVGNP